MSYFCRNPDKLIDAEKFVFDEIDHFIRIALPEIVRDYNEASYLYPFWKNYPPEDRGRSPKHDQYPWIEVGEHVFGPKLSRYFSANFSVRDSGLPSGSDDRYVVSGLKLKEILGITDTVWVFIDIKSVGPRDNFAHAVMSNYQISGDGIWENENAGVTNSVMRANGARVAHDFHCSIPPFYVLSDGTVVPVLVYIIKPIYSMLSLSFQGRGQPLEQISLASIPNGILLCRNPNYLSKFPSLLFPGKDDKGKDPRKMRARISFSDLQRIDAWRLKTYQVRIS